VQLTTSDGERLDADLADSLTMEPIGDVVICHPHPLFGGNRFNIVVETLFTALPATGFRALRFDFRSTHGDGVDERLDVVAAIDALDALDEPTSRPMFLVGYSFGAAVALNTRHRRIDAMVAIAPPLTTMSASEPTVPTLVITPRHDQFCAPEEAAAIVASWPGAEFQILDAADHFLSGSVADAAEQTSSWLVERTRRS